MKAVLAGLAVALALGVPTPAAARGLTLEDRVRAQKAIEQVYWDHRVWPKENPTPKPPLSAVLPDGVTRKKVEDSLRMSALLESFWRQPLTGEQLQAEIDRMAQQTKAPGMLRELFEALDDDPFVIAECLARPTLAQRRVEAAFAADERVHGSQRARLLQALSGVDDLAALARVDGDHAETTFVLDEDGNPNRSPAGAIRLTRAEWNEEMGRLAATFGVVRASEPTNLLGAPSVRIGMDATASIPLGRASALLDREDRFVVLAVRAKGPRSVTVASVSWTKRAYGEWSRGMTSSRPVDASAIRSPARGYSIPALAPGGCTNDTWTLTAGSGRPDARYSHTAVWTGTEMIVWGGSGAGAPLSTGGRYIPALDTWVVSSLTTGFGANVPSARHGQTAVWTGTEMIVWGGSGRSGFEDTGGRYNPSSDTWSSSGLTAGTDSNTPSARDSHTAVWTGSEMVVWGGYTATGFVNTGGRYSPSLDRWAVSSLKTGTGAPSSRYLHTTVWTGTEMIVWGGAGSDYFNTGGRYNPATDSWAGSVLGSGVGANVPSARIGHTAVWTGTEMIVWGGASAAGGGKLNTGGRYDPTTDAWVDASLVRGLGENVPAARDAHAAVWTGSELIVWGGIGAGGFLNTGGRYDPVSDTWAVVGSGVNAPSARAAPTAVWTGREMVIWGGRNLGPLDTGGRYDPAGDTWAPIGLGVNIRVARYDHTAVWTGSEMIVWGGFTVEGVTNTGGRYNPATDTWASSALATASGANVPTGGAGHSAVWTGTEMIVWGGIDTNGGFSSTGGRYNPSTDTWAASSLSNGFGPNVPRPRVSHIAVWTGTEMIVWGGVVNTFGNGNPYSNTGGRFDPSTDSWTASSLGLGSGANVPDGRERHTAMWTGSEMIVWGGVGPGNAPVNTGGRYDPAADSWSASSLLTGSGANVPAPRAGHSAVWTGAGMIVWGGGFVGLKVLNTGGLYDPSTDTWKPCSLTNGSGANVPTARTLHSAIWTGSEMIVWGGGGDTGNVDTGGRYDPLTDTWASSSLGAGSGANVPTPRSRHTAVWTGTEMIVWGGFNVGPLDTGGRYNPSTDRWTASTLTTSIVAEVPSVPTGHTAVWTGAEMIVWGGADAGGPTNTGGRYDPSLDTWTRSSLGDGADPSAPSARSLHTAVWTGSEMIVWGGGGESGLVNTGGRYDPATDAWSTSSLATASGANVPAGRSGHTVVWTGSEMIVWGGAPGGNTGGRYNPLTDTWAACSLTSGSGANVPDAVSGHTAIWTGSEMIVWGGIGPSGPTSRGGRYDPSRDRWAASILSDVGSDFPAPRFHHTAVWTGSEMIVWGGAGGGGALNTGGIYDPTTDTWAVSSLTDGSGASVPSARSEHTAVWSGSEMIVWGGYFALGTGGRYDPSMDAWAASSLTDGSGDNVPAGRHLHTAIWTGSSDHRMIVWGGSPPTHAGGLYCAQVTCTPHTWFRDADGDGHGIPSVTRSDCTQPPGYVALSNDCNDANVTIHPGASKACNAIDNDCDGLPDNGGDAQCDDGNVCTTKACDPVIGCVAKSIDLATAGTSAGRVDGRDLAVLAAAWNSCPGDERYNAGANLDQAPSLPASCVDATDFHLFMNAFGKSCP
jgi:hypothetical protein